MRRWHFSRLLNAQEVVAPIDEETLIGPSLPLEHAILIEYRLSYAVGDKLAGYVVGGHNGCIASEADFDDEMGLPADVWALGCAIFELRTGTLDEEVKGGMR
jgi:serine/threonine-protein kinase SRPK3